MQRNKLFDDSFLARLQQLHLIAKRLSARTVGGGQPGRRLGDGLEFADHRAYAPGDDVRFIDWPYYARMERLLLRMFHEHSESPVVILLDGSASMAGAKFDYARRVAAALAYVAVASLRRVRIQPFGDDLREPMHTGRNREQILEALDFLAAQEARGPTRLLECLRRLGPGVEPAATVLLLSDLLDCAGDLSDGLALLQQRRADTGVLHAYAPADAVPAFRGPVLLEAAETDDRLPLHVTEALLAGYRGRWEAFRRGCERTCLSRGAMYVAASTEIPFDRLVLTTLRRAGVLTG